MLRRQLQLVGANTAPSLERYWPRRGVLLEWDLPQFTTATCLQHGVAAVPHLEVPLGRLGALLGRRCVRRGGSQLLRGVLQLDQLRPQLLGFLLLLRSTWALTLAGGTVWCAYTSPLWRLPSDLFSLRIPAHRPLPMRPARYLRTSRECGLACSA